jgi:hypothetical protein
MSSTPLTPLPAGSDAAGAPAGAAGGGAAGGSLAQERLAEQLHTLTRVVETITYRLLELEESLADQEARLQELHQQTGVEHPFSGGTEQRVDDTEERLARLELLLNGNPPDPSAAASRHLQPVAGGDPVHPESVQEDCIDGPFLEEPEQPFMDELHLHDDPAAAPEHLSA